MSESATPVKVQSLTADECLYFFLRIHKERIRGVVRRLRLLRPHETPEQLARRIIRSYESLSLLGGSLLHIPLILPGLDWVLRAVGLATGAAVLTRMHLYLILGIALAFDKDIDDPARVPEMMAVVAATGAAVAAPPLVVRALALPPIIAIPVAGLTATTLTRVIGTTAIEHYSRGWDEVAEGQPSATPAA